MKGLRSSLVSILILLFMLPIYSKQIVTQYGEVFDVNIPEGMTAEDAFYEMAILYKEEKHDREAKQKEVEDIKARSSDYEAKSEAEIESLKGSISSRDELITGYKNEIRDLNKKISLGSKNTRFSILGMMEFGKDKRYGVGVGAELGWIGVSAGVLTNGTDLSGLVSIGYIFR